MVENPPLDVARLYFDEDADTRLAEALRRHGYPVETTATAGLLGTSDRDQLAYAVSQQRVLVTHNIKHFPGVHAAWVEGGREGRLSPGESTTRPRCWPMRVVITSREAVRVRMVASSSSPMRRL
jgi:hypothetical protein